MHLIWEDQVGKDFGKICCEIKGERYSLLFRCRLLLFEVAKNSYICKLCAFFNAQ
jgi:hypothetical protein